MTAEDLTRTVDYYLAPTAHGSTLSRVAHAAALEQVDAERAWSLFPKALVADLDDTQGEPWCDGRNQRHPQEGLPGHAGYRDRARRPPEAACSNRRCPCGSATGATISRSAYRTAFRSRHTTARPQRPLYVNGHRLDRLPPPGASRSFTVPTKAQHVESVRADLHRTLTVPAPGLHLRRAL